MQCISNVFRQMSLLNQLFDDSLIHKKCDVFKQNQSEVGNIDFKIEPNKAENVFRLLFFWHPSIAHISGTN